MNDYNINKGDSVSPIESPTTGKSWSFGKVLKLNTEEDQAQIEFIKGERVHIIWEFLSNLKKLKLKNFSEFSDEDITEYLSCNNTVQYNLLKAVEETTEFNEAVIKYFTKTKGHEKRPTYEDILGEYADMLIRGQIIVLQIAKLENPETEIEILKETADDSVVEKIQQKFEKFRKILALQKNVGKV